MDSNKTKIEESNKKRIESLREKLNDYKNKKNLVRSSLNDLDSGTKPKKIVFEDSESDDEKAEKNIPKPLINKKAEINGIVKKKFKLIDSESDSESESSDEPNNKNNEEAIKMFESKINLNEKKANQLIYLKSKFSNDDSRFKIDDRFIEGDEEEDQNENKEITDPKKITKKQLKNENLNSLKILEEITGKQIIRPKSLQDKESDLKNSKKKRLTTDNEINRNKMVRYDPTKDTHKVFELKKSESEEENSSSSESSEDELEIKEKIEDESADDTNNLEDSEKKTDESKFFKIEPNLKELFSSNDVFKFKFTEENEMEQEDEKIQEIVYKSGSKKNMFLKDLDFENLKKSNYSSSETESEIEEEDFNDHKNKTAYNEIKHSNGFRKNLESTANENKSFLPNFEHDSNLKEALAYFCRPKDIDLDNMRKEWLGKRETLVKECKKKHKKMVRIKRTKENESLLPWNKKHNSDFNQNKKRKNLNKK